MQIIWQGFKFRDVFVDISKEFGKAWCKGLIFKLKQNGIKVNTKVGVAYGSTLGTSLFLIIIM